MYIGVGHKIEVLFTWNNKPFEVFQKDISTNSNKICVQIKPVCIYKLNQFVYKEAAISVKKNEKESTFDQKIPTLNSRESWGS